MSERDTIRAEIRAFYAQQKDNKRAIQDLGHLEYRMFDLIERLATRGRVKRMITPRPPRYDETFFRGLEWLDSL